MHRVRSVSLREHNRGTSREGATIDPVLRVCDGFADRRAPTTHLRASRLARELRREIAFGRGDLR